MKDKLDLYTKFLKFIQDDSQKDRMQVHQQMFSTLLWCFLIPVILSAMILFMVKMGFFPQKAKSLADVALLIFPLLYSAYFLGSQVLVDVPHLFKKGGLSMSLRQTLKEGKWRTDTTQRMGKSISASRAEWAWVVDNFKMDLRILLGRTRFLIALGGALFFLLSQSFEIVDHSAALSSSLNGLPVGAELFVRLFRYFSTEISAAISLALFLVLLYLTGTQLYHSLHRYLDCAELLSKDYDSHNSN
ncbi:MAG: hypothetical protein KA715_11690 [Xanthomonadaceae bacterium]|nr:hypothetical protein [Xanthomonadaceae bacterium]